MHIHALTCAELWCEKRKDSEIVPMFLPRQPGGQYPRRPDSIKAVSKTDVQTAHVGECCAWRAGGQFITSSVNKQDRGAQQIRASLPNQ